MMRYKIYSIFSLWLFFILKLAAQDVELKARVVNPTGEGIADVHISYNNKSWQTSSNKQGYFTLQVDSGTVFIGLTHVAYEEASWKGKTKDIEEDEVINITMQVNVEMLMEATLTDEKITPVYKKERLWVKDYTFIENNILMLLPKNGRNGQKTPSLVLVDQQGELIASIAVPGIKESYLLKDCVGEIYLFGTEKCWLVREEEKKIFLYNPTKPDSILPYVKNCVTELGDQVYFQWPDYHDMVLRNVYIYKQNPNSFRKLCDVADSIRIANFEKEYDYSYYATPRPYGAGMWPELKMFGLEFLRRMQYVDWTDRRTRFKPIKAPLKKCGDKILVFDYVNNKIDQYNKDAIKVNTIAIEYPKQKFHTGEVLIDDKTDKVYAVFKKRSLYFLKEVNLNNGEINRTIKIPEYSFVKKIEVKGDKVYFLYHSDQNENMRLYEMFI